MSVAWRKPAAMIAESYEAIADLPLDVVQANLRLTLQEFQVRDNKNLTHELHNATSNAFPNGAVDKDGIAINRGWRGQFDNAYESIDEYNPCNITWDDIREARAKMLRRERDAHRPTICVINASHEAYLADSMAVNNAAFLGAADTFFKNGSLPNIYGLQFVVIPDAHHGYFSNHHQRKNGQFIPSCDAFLIEPSGFMFRHTREPITTETWRLFRQQKQAMSIWERYDYSVFNYAKVMRIQKGSLD